MFDLVVVLYCLQAVIHVSLCVFLALKGLENMLRFDRVTTFAGAGAFIFISVFIIELFLERTAPFSKYAFMASFCWMIISTSFVAIFARSSVFHIMFLVFFLMNFTLNGMFFTETIFRFGVFPLSDVSYILISIFVLLFMAPFMWYIVSFFTRVGGDESTGHSFRWLFVLPFTYFLFSCSIGRDFFAGRGFEGLFSLFISNVATYLSYLAVLSVFLKMKEGFVESSKVQLFEQMISVQNEQFSKVRSNMEQIARLRHDFRHNLVVIKGFADRGDLEGIRSYLSQWEKDDFSVDSVYCSNNDFVDIILGYYSNLARSLGFKFFVNLRFPDGFDFPSDELVVLFGNVLENAFESCKAFCGPDAFVKVDSKVLSDSMVAVKVFNSFDGKIVKKGDSFLSSKHDGMGIGTSTIRFISEKYGGSCQFVFAEGIFSVYVLLVSR